MAIKDFKAFCDRRAKRRSKLGIESEHRVEKILIEMQNKGEISSFVVHPHYSEPDIEGKDFTVVVEVDGEKVERSFGITISNRSFHGHHKNKYERAVAQFLIPPEMKTETIEAKILGLFR